MTWYDRIISRLASISWIKWTLFWTIFPIILWLLISAVRGDEPKAYPVGVEQGGSIGNAAYGHVRIKHSVFREKNTGFRYKYEFLNLTSKPCRLTWAIFDNDSKQWEVHGTVSTISVPYEHSPLWKLAPITLEVEINGKYVKVGTWYQKGPIPSR